MNTLQGGTAVITGAASGFGLEASRIAARRGMNVVMADVQPDALELAANEIRALGVQVLAVRTDVSRAIDVEALGEATRSRFGPQTQALLLTMEAHFQAHYARFFTDAAGRGEWRGGIATELAASYLQGQMALAVSRRAAGKSPAAVRAMLELAISVLR